MEEENKRPLFSYFNNEKEVYNSDVGNKMNNWTTKRIATVFAGHLRKHYNQEVIENIYMFSDKKTNKVFTIDEAYDRFIKLVVKEST